MERVATSPQYTEREFHQKLFTACYNWRIKSQDSILRKEQDLNLDHIHIPGSLSRNPTLKEYVVTRSKKSPVFDSVFAVALFDKNGCPIEELVTTFAFLPASFMEDYRFDQDEEMFPLLWNYLNQHQIRIHPTLRRPQAHTWANLAGYHKKIGYLGMLETEQKFLSDKGLNECFHMIQTVRHAVTQEGQHDISQFIQV